MPLGGQNSENVLPALNRLAPVLQREVAARVHLRRVPRLKFILDETFETAEEARAHLQSIGKDNATQGDDAWPLDPPWKTQTLSE